MDTAFDVGTLIFNFISYHWIHNYIFHEFPNRISIWAPCVCVRMGYFFFFFEIFLPRSSIYLWKFQRDELFALFNRTKSAHNDIFLDNESEFLLFQLMSSPHFYPNELNWSIPVAKYNEHCDLRLFAYVLKQSVATAHGQQEHIPQNTNYKFERGKKRKKF